ncbi:MAG TPA: tetratricopeptide repeat protein, partial [Myxococcota bacterium]|nr:tetratricopeptide repeat protein [Myxococcota bacterium]
RPFYERALRIREDLGDRRGVGEAVAALANIALSLDQPDRALELAKRAREIYASVGEFIGAASALRTMGVAESALQRYESALAHLREAVATYRGLGKKDADLSVILESLADCQESMGLTKDARESLQDALNVAKELNIAHQVSHLEARLRSRLH